MNQKLIQLPLKGRWIILILIPIIVLLAASGGRFLRFDSDYRVFFSKDNPYLLAFDELQNTYTKSDNVLFVLTPKDGQIFTQKSLSIVQELTEKAWKIPFSIRVDSITNFQHTDVEEDDLIVADLVEEPTSLNAEDLKRIEAIALAEPSLADQLISKKSDVTAINVTIQLPGKEKHLEVPKVSNYVRKLSTAMMEKYPEMNIRLTGMVIMNNAFESSAKRDMATLIPIMFAVVIITSILMLRSMWGTLATFLVIIFSIATAMGIAGWLGIAITGPSSSAPTVILTMAVADCIHLLTTYRWTHARQEGDDRQKAMFESLRVNLQPVFLTSITTAMGFLTMNFSDAPPFNDLGNIVAIGVVAAFFYSITFLPAFMSVVPARKPKATTHANKVMQMLADFVIQQRRWLLPGLALVVVAISAWIPNNELNDEFVKYFDHRVDFRRDTDYTAERLTGIYKFEYSLNAGDSNGISDPTFLKNTDRFVQWLRQQPEVTHVSSITDTFKRLNKNMHGGDEAWYKLPEARDLAAQYLLLYEMSLPYGLDLNNQVNVDKSKTRLIVTLKNLSTKEVLQIESRVHDWMAKHLPPAMQAKSAGPTIMFAYIGMSNINSMITASLAALVLISLTLILALRSLKIGLLSLIPNLVPMAMAFGIWGFLVGRVGIANSVVTSMTLGIIVDDTVHFLSKYLRARREKGLSSAEAVRFAFSSVGTALWVTTVVLVAGFSVLALSSFKLNSDMGIVTAIAIALALFIDFFWLPPLLMKLEEKKQ
ncbi:efflux RND transporter permease subunit [Magnetococcales bacterium HHB-1]